MFHRDECCNIISKTLKLADSDEIVISHYETVRCSSDLVGFMGEYYKLEINVADKLGNRKFCYFVKSVPITNEFHKDECERKGFFTKETRIYAEILPNIQKYTNVKLFPICYYTRKDLIVLEDLSKEYLHLPDNQAYNMTHYRIVLQHLAKLHAASIAWELADNFSIGEKFEDTLFELQCTPINEWYLTGVKGILFLAKMHPKYKNTVVQEFIETQLHDILCRATELTKPSDKTHNVLCHRDTWNRNIFYKFNSTGIPTDCCIVDFQLMTYCSPALDVTYMLYLTSSPNFRRQIEQQCLDFYYEELQKCFATLHIDADTITKHHFLEDCKRKRLIVLILCAICVPLLNMPEGLSNKMRAEEQNSITI